ncbi:hypothetical protein DXG01_000086 [Tephrocybe rancida]|nr:hypothetical protein DXG01_000086 [Tephrocybe rancida]
MGRLRQKGKAGAAKAYVTRSAAVKKLQCSLADFRRLCILKGIFPREPRSKKKANKGSSAPTSFYYAKDIAYLAHEPVLKKLREHKAFAKKLSRALGRGEWSSAKSLEDNKPVYRLDHIIKERYPTFIDAVRDIDDALCMIFLFASLPSNSRVPPELIENCVRLSAEWQLYVMHSRSLRKSFLSIKGVYYQAEVMDQTVTWLVPYQFTQKIPADVDVRVMLTFLELYQTLLGFVFFKLYADAGLVYPPPLDIKKDEAGAGVGAFSLQDTTQTSGPTSLKTKMVEVDGRTISSKDVRQTIKSINASAASQDTDVEMTAPDATVEEADEDFVVHPSTSDQQASASLPTLKSLTDLPQSLSTTLFAPCTFWLSRETSRPIFEFLVRSFGGRIGWPASSGSGSPLEELDESITHVIIDRPLVVRTDETSEERERRLGRKYVQPQWVVDCINAGRILLEEPYGQGKTLPPHLSPFGEFQGAYDPAVGLTGEENVAEESEDEEIEEDEEEDVGGPDKAVLKAAAEAAASSDDPAALRAAELAAEAAGVDFGTFEKEVRKTQKSSKKATEDSVEDAEKDMNKMMMSNKQKKLYEKMKYSQQKRDNELTNDSVLVVGSCRNTGPFMVGRFAASVKQSPSPIPSSRLDDLPLIVAETTTTRTEVVTTTTTTTTHFFSLPLWRKRGPFSSSSSPQNTLGVHSGVDEHGQGTSSARSSFYMVEKDLPSTPSDEFTISDSQRPGPSSSSDNFIKNEAPRFMSQSRRPIDNAHSLPAKQSTAALVHASLGVGLSHTLPRPSLPHSSGEVNTVAFAQPSRSSDPQPRLRKSKSALRLGAILSSERAVTDIVVGEEEHRRSRGISLNGSTLLNQVGKNDEKGKQKERKEHMGRPSTSSHTTPKSLARRASFWSRRKLHPQDTPASTSTDASRLAILQPISPFNTNFTVTPSSPSPNSNQRNTHTRGLSRSHSAHSSLRLTPSELEVTPSTDRTRDVLENAPSASPTSFPLTPKSIEPVHESSTPIDEGYTPKRRPRAQTNPPLLNRLSLGWLSPPSPSIPPQQRLSTHSPVYPRPSTSSGTFANPSKGRSNTIFPSNNSPSSSRSSGLPFERGTPTVIPLPTGGEEPPSYLRRLQAAVSKAEVAGILASSPDTFYSQALRTYIGEFNFVDDPLDVALRKLLMEVGLPRETQQIDRVIEAFASRYLQCNPALFTSDDHPYILAFSLIMLHTDAFNKSNKRKMSKADYIKNTRLPGISPEVLECFYDNIVFAPFIFIEDPLDINGQRGITHDGSNQSIGTGVYTIGTPITASMRTTKVDPYYLITNNLLGPLRVDVETTIPRENPYSYDGTAGPWDEARLQQLFAKASRIEVSTVTDLGRVSPFFTKGAVGGLASPPGNNGFITPAPTSVQAADTWTLKLTKVGLVNRKDDVLDGGKKAPNRKWKTWSVILTGSQLLFFRDPSWATSLHSLASQGNSLFPQSALFKPDELLSLRNAIAVYDKSYTRVSMLILPFKAKPHELYVKYDNTLRLLLFDGRQLLLQAPDEKELNEWVAGINYASAFKTAGVRIRPLEMSRTDVQLTGVAAATSHLHDLQAHTIKPHVWDGDTPHDLMEMLSSDPETVIQRPTLKRKLKIVTNVDDMDLEVPTAPEVDGAEQFKATFDQVKADLAARLTIPSSPDPTLRTLPPSANSLNSHASNLPSRTSIIQSKIDDLQLRITAAQSQLDTNMRFVRNVATLTPFQKSTRDRLVVAVQNIAGRVMQARLEVTRLICHRDILTNDIESEGRSWHRAKALALQAATETLQSRREVIPRMTLSQPASNPTDSHLTLENSLLSRPFDSSSRRSVSSNCDSFHSALDFGPDWPSTEDASSSFLGTSHLLDSPTTSTTPSVHSHSTSDGNAEPPRRNSTLHPHIHTGSPHMSGEFSSHEKYYTALEAPVEQAEDWDQTRCAQRVSLVRLPSDIQLRPRLVRHSQQAASAMEEDSR